MDWLVLYREWFPSHNDITDNIIMRNINASLAVHDQCSCGALYENLVLLFAASLTQDDINSGIIDTGSGGVIPLTTGRIQTKKADGVSITYFDDGADANASTKATNAFGIEHDKLASYLPRIPFLLKGGTTACNVIGSNNKNNLSNLGRDCGC